MVLRPPSDRRPSSSQPSNAGRPLDLLDLALRQVGDRWSLLVVASLLGGPLRFTEFLADLDGLSPNILTARLRQLEADGLVVARLYSARPKRFTYELTARGAQLERVISAFSSWASSGRGDEVAAEEDDEGLQFL